MDSYRLVMVNYLNSKPFEFGLKKYLSSFNISIKTATPSICASDFIDGLADIALIPVGALHDLKDYKIISDYCIGCDGEVRTVCIFSNDPIENCSKLWLDNHSRTSYLLSKILLKGYFKIDPETSQIKVGNQIIAKDEAIMMIGDKVFEHERNFKYKYDLGTIWKEWTGLPFVFAVWVTKKDISPHIEENLNHAFKLGIEHLPEIIKTESSENLDLYYYFNHNIHYNFDKDKKNGLRHFIKLADHILYPHSNNSISNPLAIFDKKV